MMKRRFFLLAFSFGIVMLVFGLYWLLAGGGPATTTTSGGADVRKGDPNADAGIEPKIYVYDKTNRLQAVYKAASWRRQENGGFYVTEPDVTLYLKGGQSVTIRGDEGTLYAEEIAQGAGFNVRHGNLKGHVVIKFYRGVSAEREAVKILMNHVYFNNDDLQIHSNGPIQLLSDDVDVKGEQLSLMWNESPRELRKLEIARTEYIAIKRLKSDVGLLNAPSKPAKPAEATAATTEPARPVMTASAESRPATRPTAATNPAEGANRYVAELKATDKLINVEGGDQQSLRNARVIRLVFDWAERSDDSDDEPAGLTPVTGPPPNTPTTQTATAAAPPAETTKPLIIAWGGPLTITPAGYTPTPDSKRYVLSAEGDDLVLADPQARADCRRFEFYSPEQKGVLIGAPNDPVVLTMSQGQEIVAPRMEFDRTAGTATLTGPGRMKAPSGDQTAGLSAAPVERRPTKTGEPATFDVITWQGQVVAKFGEEKVTLDDGTAKTRPIIREAAFSKGVQLVQGATGDTLRSENLTVWMSQGDAGRYTLQKAEAVGKVAISSQSDPNRALVAHCDKLVSDIPDRTATLYGRPATVVSGDDTLRGEKIYLIQGEHGASDGRLIVYGKGSLDFKTDRDLSGATLPEKCPVHVQWTRQLHYDGRKNAAFLYGDVAMDRDDGQDVMNCDKMELWFAESDKTETDAGKERSAVGMESYSGRSLKLVRAYGTDKKPFVVRSCRMSDTKEILQRLYLTGGTLLYEADKKQMSVLGRGALLVEDYRPPEPGEAKSNAGSGVAGAEQVAIERPWQTRFTWQKSMVLTQQDHLEVTLLEKAVMDHRSGRQMVIVKGMNIPKIENMPEGRKSILGCEKMVAIFGKPEKTAENADASGPKIGPLETFSAVDNVNFRDGPWQLLGQRLIYKRQEGASERRGSAVLWGYAAGRPERNAMAIRQNRYGGQSQEISSPVIRCTLRDGQLVKVEAMKMRVGSGGN